MMRRMMARRRNGISIHMMDVQRLGYWSDGKYGIFGIRCVEFSMVGKLMHQICLLHTVGVKSLFTLKSQRTHLFILHSSDAHSSMNHDVPAPVMLTRLLITNSPEIQSGTSCHGCLKLATPAAVAGSGEDTTVKGASALQHDAATIIYAFPVASVPAGDCIIFFFFIAWWQSHGIQPEEWIRVDRDGSRLTAAAVVRSKAYLWKREIAH
ncbi:hypothetical protein MUK42_03001 [Musa troglodytarum]|uniref:Uncharacterized protein n=1 Tax=Musa troglodytarum TaxID=320322 RepID=A0A9E7EN84_9LILI|nr:hypothetical protein MUK42_02638 [Musa troglodytarum]URD80619.1 hypothetical protein MUK42_03001 [Musa troglodytarum]